ncbi:hypothetical protein [Bartonella sp. AR 15-3]|uniref:hypothetical protein n=1 Tax=Bartonella sp. AR 15-3 TaxID=545617 RepID=UPI0001F4BF74|nr:hypothetical protein [Bartonella sp. AR 15-3]OPB31128.1 hypothetical protein BAR153v2_000660 [Bartonella sp. AR 15-3]CBI78742.1 exported hypothetical protein [Bartonella sp. AR 15-3]
MNIKYFIIVMSFTMMTASTVQGFDLKEEIPLISSTFRVSEWNEKSLKDFFLVDGHSVYSKWEEITEPEGVIFASNDSRKIKCKKKKGSGVSNHRKKKT